ncbi:MAG: hypothetical protein P4L71_14745 [Acetobacteraceae bacterium]|nr:hypothetical protein [Acetobacteraceae bacterium]
MRFDIGTLRPLSPLDPLFDTPPDQPVPSPCGRGAPRLLQAERREVALRATSLDEPIGPDHLARLVWEMVQRFDLQPLLDTVDACEGTPGHPQTDPAILAALWLYATLDGVGSARERLARVEAALAAMPDSPPRPSTGWWQRWR